VNHDNKQTGGVTQSFGLRKRKGGGSLLTVFQCAQEGKRMGGEVSWGMKEKPKKDRKTFGSVKATTGRKGTRRVFYSE